MIRPPPPHKGKSTKRSPSFSVNKGQPTCESRADASLSNSQETQEVSIKAIAKPSSSVSAWAKLRIDNGSVTSTKLVWPRSRRTRTIIEAAVAEMSAAFAYSPTRKSMRDEAVQAHHDQPRNNWAVLVVLRP